MLREPAQITIEARGLRFPALACGEGPLVLCLHGFPDTPHTFRHQLRAFAEAGYRAVAPCLRGYDSRCLPSPRACNVLEASLDASALVTALGERRAHLVGHDWGAVAAYLTAAQAPDFWLSVATLAVPHPLGILQALRHVPQQARKSWYMAFFQLRGVAERAAAAGNFALIERLWHAWSPGYDAARELEAVRRALVQPGVLEAALAYYRNLLDPSSPSHRRARALLHERIELPVLALTGAQDGCIDTRTYDFAMQERWFSELLVERMLGVGHFLHLEAPTRVSTRLLAWFEAHPST